MLSARGLEAEEIRLKNNSTPHRVALHRAIHKSSGEKTWLVNFGQSPHLLHAVRKRLTSSISRLRSRSPISDFLDGCKLISANSTRTQL
jgi:hypothetical protein